MTTSASSASQLLSLRQTSSLSTTIPSELTEPRSSGYASQSLDEASPSSILVPQPSPDLILRQNKPPPASASILEVVTHDKAIR
ncbi:hypothetical protein Ciccas_010600, partial [Cichlidogyrus casuarinus]